ncbi:hypothetical protein [Nocardia sp. NPDC048505]|uniref:hypothetical protein n=1 Tax=unclassified Nocardia TaxID=2637762 RepID=UPI0033F30B37
MTSLANARRRYARLAIASAFAAATLSLVALPATASAAPQATPIGAFDDCEPNQPCWDTSLNNPANPASPLNLNNPASPSSALSPLSPLNPANPMHPYQLQPTI